MIKVLWLCNITLPVIARQLGIKVSNKEGWLSGLADTVLERQKENDIALSIAFPISKNFLSGNVPSLQRLAGGVVKAVISAKGTTFVCYGFPEEVSHAENYDKALEESLKNVIENGKPDIVHCFGTEYPHTLAMCRIFPRKERLLVGLQGLCALYAKAYYADLPESVIHSLTLRDFLKRDSLIQQQEKFAKRGKIEQKSMKLAGNLTGRTQWDRAYAETCHPKAQYYHMNETLRPEFYGPVWKADQCLPHSIFISQGDYPLKGLHYMLLALPVILAKYPDTKVYVAGNCLTRCSTLKERLKLSAYGKYLRRLIGQKGLESRVVFLGRLDVEQMRDRYLASHLFVCPSALENSPNSLGEAMLLGMPCVSADVGGIPSLFVHEVDGILYQGYKIGEGKENNGIPGRLAKAVIKMWSNPSKMEEYCQNARKHAMLTHNRDKNYRKLTEIYQDIYRNVPGN